MPSITLLPKDPLILILSYLDLYDHGLLTIAMYNHQDLRLYKDALFGMIICFGPGRRYVFSDRFCHFMFAFGIKICDWPEQGSFIFDLIESPASSEKIALFKALLPDTDITCRYKECTMLQTACKFGNLEIVKFLHSIGNNFQECYESGVPYDSDLYITFKYACEHAYEHGCHNIIEYLFSTYPHAPKYSEYLSLACKNGHAVTVKFLLSKGWCPNAGRTQNITPPLVFACKGESYEIAKILLEGGADVNYGAPINIIFFKNRNIRDLLIEAGATVNSPNPSYFYHSLLYQACLNNSLEDIKILVKAGADVNYRRAPYSSPLSLVCRNDNLDAIKLLLLHGVITTTLR